MNRAHAAIAAAAAALITPTAHLAAASENNQTIPIAEVAIDIASFPAQTQTYDIRMHGKTFDRGTPFPLETTLQLQTSYDAQGNPVFNDTLDFMGRTFSFHLVCQQATTLTPTQGTITMEHRNRSLTASVTRDPAGDELNLTTSDNQTRTIHFPRNTVTNAALLRIATRLPTTPGVTYTFPAYCPVSKLEPEVPAGTDHCTLSCRGTRTVQIDGQSVACTEFVANFEGDMTLLVDEQHTLRKIITDKGQTEIVLVESDTSFAEAGDDD